MTISPALIDQIEAVPEVREEQEGYWTCMASMPEVCQRWWQRKKGSSVAAHWIAVFESIEDAEAYGAGGWSEMIWDRQSAVPITLYQAMTEARRSGRPGVVLMGYVCGRWTSRRTWPASVPLSG